MKNGSKRKNKGFTLTEVLVAVLIMTLVTMVTASGLPAAIRTYKEIVSCANAQMLMSTTTNTLRGWLDQAQVDTTLGTQSSGSTVIDFGTTITFTTAAAGKCTISSEDGGIMIDEYQDSSITFPKRMLVSSSAGGGDLYPVFEKVTYDTATGVITITNLKIMNSKGEQVLNPTTFSTRTFDKY